MSATNNNSEASENVYRDLIGFLQASRADLRTAATEAVIAVVDREGMTNLIKHGVVQHLCRLASRDTDDDDKDQSNNNALKALLHLSSNGPSAPQCVEDMMDAGGVRRMTEIALSSGNDENWRKRANLSLALLANMTRTERGAVEFVGRSVPDEAIPTSQVTEGEEKDLAEVPSKPTLPLLLSRFLSGSYIVSKEDNEDEKEEEKDGKDDDDNGDDPYQHFAAVLMNTSQIEAGRKFILRLHHDEAKQLPTSVLQSILPQLRSFNPVRRRGVAGTIKNCCFDTDSSWWLLNEVNIAKDLCYPLAGPEELDVDEKKGLDPDLWIEGPDKVREKDKMTRLFLVESVLLLCASGRKSREVLRKQRVYVILKMADMVEESEEVSERINECVQFLRRDEEGTEEGSSDKRAQEAWGGGEGGQRLALPAPSASKEVGVDDPDEDYDDVD